MCDKLFQRLGQEVWVYVPYKFVQAFLSVFVGMQAFAYGELLSLVEQSTYARVCVWVCEYACICVHVWLYLAFNLASVTVPDPLPAF